MSTLTITDDQRSALALIAGTLAGGRHAFRVTDETIKREATERAVKSRRERRATLARERRNARSDRRERVFADYDIETLERIAELRAVWASMPKRSLMRRIARAILHDRSTCRECKPLAKNETCERGMVPDNWRDTVRAFRDGSRKSAELGSFPIKRDDQRITTSVLMLSARKHWHEYAGGRHVTVHGADVEDAFQSGMLAALESGDYVKRERPDGTFENIPTYGRAFWHVRASVNALATGRSLAGIRTFGTWNDEIEPFTLDEFIPRTVNDWLAYETHRDVIDSRERYVRRIAAEREERLAILSETRKSLAMLIHSGMSVRAIAGALGRTPSGILSDLSGDMAPAQRFLPHVVTDAEREDARTRVLAQAEHALRLRRIAAIAAEDSWQANYAAGSIRANGETVGNVPEWNATPAPFTVNPDAGEPLALSPLPRIAWKDNAITNVA